jgi:hypothetical protein
VGAALAFREIVHEIVRMPKAGMIGPMHQNGRLRDS